MSGRHVLLDRDEILLAAADCALELHADGSAVFPTVDLAIAFGRRMHEIGRGHIPTTASIEADLVTARETAELLGQLQLQLAEPAPGDQP